MSSSRDIDTVIFHRCVVPRGGCRRIFRLASGYITHRHWDEPNQKQAVNDRQKEMRALVKEKLLEAQQRQDRLVAAEALLEVGQFAGGWV